MRVYWDLVLILNFGVDLLLLLASNALSGHPPGFARCAAGAALGGLYGVICLLPGMGCLSGSPVRMAVLAVMAAVSFGWSKSSIRRGALFLLLSMALGGMALGLYGGGMLQVLGCGGVILLLCRFGLGGKPTAGRFVKVELEWMQKRLEVTALVDTGNGLCDPVTGEGVLIAGADVGAELLGLTEEQLRDPVGLLQSGAVRGMRLIPYRSVGQKGSMMPAVRLRRAKIDGKYSDPLVAFAPEKLAGEYRMLTGGNV